MRCVMGCRMLRGVSGQSLLRVVTVADGNAGKRRICRIDRILIRDRRTGECAARGLAFADHLSEHARNRRRWLDRDQTPLTRADRDMSLASTEMSPDFLSVPNISITTTAPSDGTSSRTFSYRPSHMRSLSAFADSEAASDDFTSDITRPVSRARHSALSDVADDSASMMRTGYMSLSSKLERIVSMDARLEAENPGFGIEFLHSGHDEEAWVAYKREKRQRRGIVRRWVALGRVDIS